jgi:hypothetical protein
MPTAATVLAATEDKKDRAAYSIAEWCFEGRISTALYYKRQAQGFGPRTVHMAAGLS